MAQFAKNMAMMLVAMQLQTVALRLTSQLLHPDVTIMPHVTNLCDQNFEFTARRGQEKTEKTKQLMLQVFSLNSKRHQSTDYYVHQYQVYESMDSLALCSLMPLARHENSLKYIWPVIPLMQ